MVMAILRGVEAMRMIKKEQIAIQNQSIQNKNILIQQLFGLTA